MTSKVLRSVACGLWPVACGTVLGAKVTPHRLVASGRSPKGAVLNLEVISIVVLAIMFIIGIWRGVNMGLMGYVAACLLGVFGLGLSTNEALVGFPVDLFVTLVGLTYLFSFAQNNGALHVLVHWCARLVRGKVSLAPWILFFLTAAGLIAFGALFAAAIIAPLALNFACKHSLNTFMTGLLVVHGALAGAFSPISVYGIFVNDFLISNGFESSPLTLFLAPFFFNLVFAAVV